MGPPLFDGGSQYRRQADGVYQPYRYSVERGQ